MFRRMNRLLIVFVLVLSLISILFMGSFQTSASTGQPASWQEKVDAWVLDPVNALDGGTEFLVYLSRQADLSMAVSMKTKAEKGAYVFKQLTGVVRQTQPALLAELDRFGVEYRPFWVANMIWVRGGLNVVEAMAQRSDVAHIYANPYVRLELPPLEPGSGASAIPDAPEANLVHVRAPEVWAAGYTGQGAVVGGQDTGYDWDHPALKNQYRGWNGSSADHNYNWHDAIHSNGGAGCPANSPAPCDGHGHGTHTMGIMVGDDDLGNQVGMAPGARWIGCRNMNSSGDGTPVTYAECFEWFIAPYPVGGSSLDGDPTRAPDVINNSWSCTSGEGCTDPNALLTVVNNTRAAGILVVVSAGNNGPGCSTVSNPAGIYDASFTVGNTLKTSDTLNSGSSRGPVTIDGSGRLKPDISAPGTQIRSSIPGTGYTEMTGTSMAAPHVAGLVALLISAQRNLAGQVDVLENIITQSAFHIYSTACSSPDGVPNNLYGWGRIDAMQALTNVPHHFILVKEAPPVMIPGQPITYTLAITHNHSISLTTNVVLSDVLPVGTSFITATMPHTRLGNSIQWDFASLNANQSRTVQLVVGVPVTATTDIVNAVYGVRSDEVNLIQGTPVISRIMLGVKANTSMLTVLPGGYLTYTLTVTNVHPTVIAHGLVLTDTLPTGTTFFTATLPYAITNGVVRWEKTTLDPLAIWTVQLILRAPLNNCGTIIQNKSYGVISDEVPSLIRGPAVSTFLGYIIFLPVMLN